MKSRLTNILFERYPILYRERTMTLEQSSMPWGFRCGDGWYKPIEDLSVKLEAILQESPEDSRPSCSGVTQLEGSLRFEMRGYLAPEISQMIERVKEQCMHTCERCGFSPAHMRLFREQGQQVLCNKHAKQRREAK